MYVVIDSETNVSEDVQKMVAFWRQNKKIAALKKSAFENQNKIAALPNSNFTINISWYQLLH